MKIVRYFIHTEWEDVGSCGFQPLWVPKSSNFNPSSSARLLAHDMLEHRLCDTGKMHEEVMAFGRIVALRVFPGVMKSDYRSVESSLGDEIGSIWSDVVNEQCDTRCLAKAPETAGVNHYRVEHNLKLMAANAMVSVNKHLKDHHEQHLKVHLQQEKDVLGWLRIGYLDALRRYGEQDHGCYDNGTAAFGWADSHEAKQIEEYAEDELNAGHVLRLCWDTVQLRMAHRFYEPSDDYGRFPGWLRRRVWAWNNRSA